MRIFSGPGLRYLGLSLLCLNLAFVAVGPAYATKTARAYITVIIDDLGVDWANGLEAIRLPGPVAVAVIPNRAYSTRLALRAHGERKDVLLHLPMEPVELKDLLPADGLRTDMSEKEIYRSVEVGLASVPNAIAINNHMGSEFTSSKRAMSRLMAAVRAQNPELFFVDSLTTSESVVRQQATAYGIQTLARSVFLDNERSEEAIEKQFDELLSIARKYGGAIAIGHPFPETLAVLQRRLAPLSEGEVRLIPITMLMAMKIQGQGPWR
ncbi:MAG: divergent polysaccharide deacetylase family protein [Acidiferrobacterales bacterium]